MFNEATQNIYKISYYEYYTERRVIKYMITQVDIGSSQQVNSPKFLIGAHQTRAGADTTDKNDNIAIFDNLDLRKYFIEVDGLRYPRDGSLMIYEENDFFEQYRDLRLVFKKHTGEPKLSPCIPYLDLRKKYLIEIID